MVKAVTPVPLLLLNFLAGKEKPSWMQFSIVIVVSVGVVMASVGELNFSLVGFIIQVHIWIQTYVYIYIHNSPQNKGLKS